MKDTAQQQHAMASIGERVRPVTIGSPVAALYFIGDRAAFGIDRLFVDVFLRRQPGVLVVFDQLEINETK